MLYEFVCDIQSVYVNVRIYRRSLEVASQARIARCRPMHASHTESPLPANY